MVEAKKVVTSYEVITGIL